MKVFAGYNRTSFSTIKPFIEEDDLVINNYCQPITDEQSRGVNVIDPKPSIEIEVMNVKEGFVKNFEILCANYILYFLGKVEEFNPELFVLSPTPVGNVAFRVCEYLGRESVYLVPPYFEFKGNHLYSVWGKDATYLVSGEYGAKLVEEKGGVPIITGNPKFDVLFKYKYDHTKQTKRILYAKQDVVETDTLTYYLEHYCSRMGIELVTREHPSCHKENVSFIEQALECDVLVGVTSLTMLEAMILGIPVVGFKKQPGRTRTAFCNGDDILLSTGREELYNNLSNILFDKMFRNFWCRSHKKAYKKYVAYKNSAKRIREILHGSQKSS